MGISRKISERLWNQPDKGELESQREEKFIDEIIQKNQNIRLAGPGAFARTIPNEILVKIMNESKQRADFLDFCYKYDSNTYVCGMGKDNLLAVGEIRG